MSAQNQRRQIAQLNPVHFLSPAKPTAFVATSQCFPEQDSVRVDKPSAPNAQERVKAFMKQASREAPFGELSQ
jgi:hypothetical protein